MGLCVCSCQLTDPLPTVCVCVLSPCAAWLRLNTYCEIDRETYQQNMGTTVLYYERVMFSIFSFDTYMASALIALILGMCSYI